MINKGRGIMNRIRIATAAITLAVATTQQTGCQAPTSSSPAHQTTPVVRQPVHQAPRVDYDAGCDSAGHAFNVRPDTANARAAAEEACQNDHRLLEDLNWKWEGTGR